MVWSRSFEGGTSSEFSSIAIDATANAVVAGAQCNGPSYPCYDSIFLTVKYDINGNQPWVRTHGPGGEATAVAVDSQANAVVAGHICTSFGPEARCLDFDYSTVKYDPNGNQLWATTFTNPIGGEDRLTSLAVDLSDNVFVSGYVCKVFNSRYERCRDYEYKTMKYSPVGAQIWSATYHSGDVNGPRITLDAAGNLLVTGYSCVDCFEGDFVTLKYAAP